MRRAERRLQEEGGHLTARRRAGGKREALRETEILQTVFDNIPIMISLRDTSGRILLVNREWERVLGWTLEEALRIDLFAEIYPDPDVRRRVLSLLQGGGHAWVDLPMRTRDGRSIEASWTRVVLSSGIQVGFGQDITGRKRLENELKSIQTYLAEGQKLSQTGSWARDVASGEVYWSQETFRIFGLDPETTKPDYQLFLQRLHPEDRPLVEREVERAFREKTDLDHHYRVLRPDGSIQYVHSRSRPVIDESGELVQFLSAVTNVTEHRLAEERLRHSYDQLQALSDRLRVVREEEGARIARQVHDEIGQALTALQMDVAWLENRVPALPIEPGGPLSAKLGSMASLLEQTVDAVQRIATELRPRALDELGLEAAVEWYVRDFERRAGVACHLRCDLEGAPIPPGLSTAAFRILQEALTNLWRHSGATRADVRLSVDAEQLRLEIEDNGHGVAAERVADVRSLGLLGMQERARSVGGGVTIHGVPGHGTLVTLTVPL